MKASFLYANEEKIYHFKAKDSERNACSLGYISKDCTDDDLTKTALNSYEHDFSVDFGSIDVDDIF